MRSPYDGLVTRRDRDPGGIVVPGASILQLVATNEIWVSAWVDETAMTGLKVDQPARVVFRSEPAKNYAGEVARLGRETDRETRRVRRGRAREGIAGELGRLASAPRCSLKPGTSPMS